jgi:hypothetical protein
MPTKSRPEDVLVELFLSVYDHDTWQGCHVDWADRQRDGAVEVVATRADGRTLAIEHTLIESFVGEREDLERSKAFFTIEEDRTVWVPGKILYVNVPRGVLQKGQEWRRIVDGVHGWLRLNIASLPDGESMQSCPIDDAANVELLVRVLVEPKATGQPIIRRYGPIDVAETVEKALAAKLPKLVGTPADIHVLLLERNQWTLSEKEIHDHIEERRPKFPALQQVDVWLAESVAMSTDRLRGYAEFKRYLDREVVESIAFNNGQLFSRFPQVGRPRRG